MASSRTGYRVTLTFAGKLADLIGRRLAAAVSLSQTAITRFTMPAAANALAVTPLSAPPRGRHGDPEMDEPPNVGWVVLHMIEETARHAGHLDIARELIDGQTGLGPR